MIPRSTPRSREANLRARPAAASLRLHRTAEGRRWMVRLTDGGPFFFFAGAAFLLAVLAATGQVHWGTGHVALWGLFVGLGLIVSGGGVAALLLDEEPTGGQNFEFDERESVLVPRREWEALRARLGEVDEVPTGATLSAPPPAPSPSVEHAVDLVRELERLAAEARATPLAAPGPAPETPPVAPGRQTAAPSVAASISSVRAASGGGTTVSTQSRSPGAPPRPSPVAPPRPARASNPSDWKETAQTAEPALTPELQDFLRELDRSLVSAGARETTAKANPTGAACAGCGTILDDRAARYRCVSCWKAICPDCRERAIRGKRAALCAECGAAVGIDPSR